jgi:hypothetical protein
VTYVQFSASNFIAEAEREVDQTPNLAERIEANYQRLGGTNFFRSAKSPEEAKEMIRKEFIKDEALKTARKQAYDFANKLDSIQPVSSENLEKLAAKMNFAAQLSEPFDRQYPPSDLKVRADFNKQAFTLTAEEPFGGPIVGEDAAFVIALSKRLPSETPTFDEIRARVTKDCRFNQAVMRARRDGSTFAAVLAAGLPNGKSFAALCVEAKVHPVALPPFSLSTRSFPEVEQHASLVQFKQAAFSAAPGKASEFVETDEGGFVVFVQSKLPVDESKLRADLPQYMGYVRRAREGEAFNDWFRREADRGLRDTPLARRQPTAGGIPTE